MEKQALVLDRANGTGKSTETEGEAKTSSERYESRKRMMPGASLLAALCIKWKGLGL